jgi:hypothetical protein
MDKLSHGGHFVMGPGWAGFADPSQYLRYVLVLVAATASGAVLAYHPVHRGRQVSLIDMEQRKTLIIYSVVGALIAVICAVNPSMAFVIFGIGGLMRFRTDVGESKSTGHTIMATLVGLCWGLGLELVAVLATLYFWLMVWVLESGSVRNLTVGGIAVADMTRSADAYREAFARARCRVLGHNKNFKVIQMTFVVHMADGAAIERATKEVEAIPELLRGIPDWSE